MVVRDHHRSGVYIVEATSFETKFRRWSRMNLASEALQLQLQPRAAKAHCIVQKTLGKHEPIGIPSRIFLDWKGVDMVT